ncbi:hypothetical protein [Sphingomonas sp. Leaf28]|uniref:hypothetical protein n=1 Tax=Sphingomonas sp. Leaf28 TaxID=1735695 RepID=UPI0006FB19C9|nr:hypothetical protein [Sphingomonas sp. Leaf28]KQN12028.1 hypothetical protein ASE79_08395 [Sphingomonas sp. Leaf28]
MGEIIGRQPATYLITPSKPRPAWYGTIEGGEKTGFGGHSITGGKRFTNEQARECISRGLDVLTAPAITVKRNSSIDEIWSGAHGPRPVYQFECPIIRRMADGRVRVIAPSGVEKIVEADGWTSPDRKQSSRRSMAA